MPADRILDIWFEDTVSNPLQEVEKIYAFMDRELSDQARAEMNAWQAFNKRELRPPHDYALADFGFSEDMLKRQFSRYREEFITPRQV